MLLDHNVQLDDSIILTVGRKFGGLNVSKFGQKKRFRTEQQQRKIDVLKPTIID